MNQQLIYKNPKPTIKEKILFNFIGISEFLWNIVIIIMAIKVILFILFSYYFYSVDLTTQEIHFQKLLQIVDIIFNQPNGN